MQQAILSRRSAIWRTVARSSRQTLPEDFSPWLLDSSSLTQRVIAVCGGRFRVQLLALAWGRPLPDEAARLALRAGERSLVRQVQLLCNERPWVYARTVIPRSTLTGRNRRLAHLGSKPLGAALFADPTMERDEVEITRITPGSALYALATQGLPVKPDEIWGRRSVFRVSDRPLLVSEIFLPGIPKAPCR